MVVTPNAYYHWIPSNIWVGVGRMTIDEVRFKLDKRYKKVGIVYKQAKAVSFHPEGDSETDKGFVTIKYTGQERVGEVEKVDCDFLINADYTRKPFEEWSVDTMTVNPIVQDWDKYPEYGRSLSDTMGEAGLAGHWLKWFIHYMFLHKAKGFPFWWLLPE